MVCLLRVGFDGAEEPDAAGVAPVTERLGNYRIEHRDDGTPWELGRGAMGVTYRAVDMSLQRAVALKLIDSEWVKHGAEARERFMREARTAAALRHANVATVYHFGIREENGQCFCAMELVEGETLETRVRRTGPLDALTVVEITLQVTSALAAAEKQGLVHRDLKPANLMLVGAGSEANGADPVGADELVVKVIDFGVAKALAEKPDAMRLTHGGFVGTPAFASPEQFTNAPVDVRSDIYSLGATLWYLLTGQMPFPGANVEQIRESQQLHALPLEQLHAARVPPRVVSILVSMLALEPAARPDVRTLATRLQECRAKILDRWRAVRQFALAAGLIGLAVVAFVLFLQRQNRPVSQNAASPDISAKSIAVLPFENLGQNPDDAFFADGIQDDVLTSLAKIKDLKVISRTSVMSYRGNSPRNLHEIRKELGVAHVLEGSVRRVANRVLVNVQLIDTATDHHIWAERYDRAVADSITLQGELASEIAVALRTTLSPEEKSQLEAKATDNPEAYVFYLRGREVQLRPESSLENFLSAESFYKQAIGLDPRFVLARARLSMMQVNIYGFFEPNNAARMAEARAHAREALRLDPDCAEAHLAVAQTAERGDKETTRRELANAVRLRPNDATVVMVAAMGQWWLGLAEEAAANYKRAAELGPREPKVFYNYGVLLRATGKEAEARAALDRALVLAPESVLFRLQRADAEISWTGDIPRARAILAGLPAGQDPDGRVISAYCTLALFERNYSEVLKLLREYRAETLPPAHSGGFGLQFPKAYSEGMVFLFAGDRAKAFEHFDSMRSPWEDDVRKRPQSPEDHCTLAMIYAWMGWRDAAMAEAARVTELETAAATPLKDRSFFDLAQVYGWLGELGLAFAQLEQYAGAPSFDYTIHKFRLDPVWDPLRNDPRFQKLLTSLAPK